MAAKSTFAQNFSELKLFVWKWSVPFNRCYHFPTVYLKPGQERTWIFTGYLYQSICQRVWVLPCLGKVDLPHGFPILKYLHCYLNCHPVPNFVSRAAAHSNGDWQSCQHALLRFTLLSLTLICLNYYVVSEIKHMS